MKRLLCPKIPKPGQSLELTADEATHATRVLRLRNDHQVEALDGQGHAAYVRLKIRGKSVWIEGIEPIRSESQLKSMPQILPITLELAILKGDAMEWAIEKCVELGVQKIVPLMTAHTVVQVGRNKGPEEFQSRWQRIADQSLKQCGRLSRLDVALPIALADRLAQTPGVSRLWCDETRANEAPLIMDCLEHHSIQEPYLLIGPEGGWNLEEQALIGLGAYSVSLGPLILRAETASLFAASAAQLFLRKKLQSLQDSPKEL